MADHQRAAELGRQAAREALEGRRTGTARRPFTITKFDRHPDGYYHARVTPEGGVAIYCHEQSGSWMAPGEQNGRAVMKEILPHVARVLVEMQRKDEARRRKEQSEHDASLAVAADETDDPGGEDGA